MADTTWTQQAGMDSVSDSVTTAGYADAAEASAIAAALSETNAATSEANAAGSATSAATSASNASTSATSSASSATAAAGSATAASGSASAASTSATNAASSASAASTSATNAAGSATTAGSYAANALASETAAGTSETNAASSATSAASSATAASGSASSASTYATNAANSATTAAGHVTSASNYATNAANSAAAAAGSAADAANAATTAAADATAAVQDAVDTANTYAVSAGNHAAAALTSKTNAATSETNAASSATSAATSETNAASSATSAATSASNASASASVATTQATAASTYATQAAGSATTAASESNSASAFADSAAASAANAVAVVTGGTASLTAEAGKIPIADANGHIDHNWVDKDKLGLQYTPSVHPTLSSDFTRNEHKRYEQYGPEPKTILQQLSVARNSEATYFDANGVLKIAGINEPRIDYDPATGECRGLLVEEQSTNLLTRSEEFDSSAWTKSNVTVTPNVAIAPDGTLTAEKVMAVVGTGYKVLRRYWFNDDLTKTASVYVKKSSSHAHVSLRTATSSTCRFNMDTGEFEYFGITPESYGSEYVGDGWWRIWVTGTQESSDYYGVLPISSTGTSENYSSTGEEECFIWGYQLEEGSFPTSYIPTTTAQVTRVADQITPTV